MAEFPVPLDNLISYVKALHPAGGPLENVSDAFAVSTQMDEQSDALIGYFVDQARRSGLSWSQIGGAMGVSKQAAQKRFVPTKAADLMPPNAKPFSRFTDRAVRVIAAAGNLAAAEPIGAAHITAALLTEPEGMAAKAIADLLIVHSRLSFLAASLPAGSLDQIKSVPGVKLVVPVDIFGATYQKPTQGLGVVAISLVKDWPSAFTFTIAPEYLAAFQKLRTATLVRKELAEKYGWKIGDRIPLMSHTAQMDGSTDWAFDVVGTFSDSDVGSGPRQYSDQFGLPRRSALSRQGHRSALQCRNFRADSRPRRYLTKSTAASPIPPRKPKPNHCWNWRKQQAQDIGDMNFLIRAIVGAALAALLFATASMMMQSIRERQIGACGSQSSGLHRSHGVPAHTGGGVAGVRCRRGIWARAGYGAAAHCRNLRSGTFDAEDRPRDRPRTCHRRGAGQRRCPCRAGGAPQSRNCAGEWLTG